MIITLSYLLRYLFRILHRSPKKVSMFQLLGGLYTLKIAHLLFLMVTSDNVISLFKLIASSKGFQIRSFLTYSINHAPPQRPCRGGGCRGVTPLHPTFFEFLGILVKCVGKISWPNVVGKFAKCRILSISSAAEIKLLPAMTTLKKLHKICTDDYDNNEYLAVKYTRFFTINIIWCL